MVAQDTDTLANIYYEKQEIRMLVIKVRGGLSWRKCRKEKSKKRKKGSHSGRKSDGDKLGVWCGIAIGKKTP